VIDHLNMILPRLVQHINAMMRHRFYLNKFQSNADRVKCLLWLSF